MLARFAAALSFCAAAVLAAENHPVITSPSSQIWWIADSLATIAWDCNDKTHDQWTVLIAQTTNMALLPSPLAITAQQYNYDCSKSFTPTGLAVGTGYVVQFANVLNSTDVYSQSEPFEVKPKGSLYPTVSPSSPGGGGSTGTSTGTGASPTGTGKGGAANSIKPQWAMGLLGAVGAVFAL